MASTFTEARVQWDHITHKWKNWDMIPGVLATFPPHYFFLGANFSKSQTIFMLTFSPISSTSNIGLTEWCFSKIKEVKRFLRWQHFSCFQEREMER